jgi:hypothetical protein
LKIIIGRRIQGSQLFDQWRKPKVPGERLADSDVFDSAP